MKKVLFKICYLSTLLFVYNCASPDFYSIEDIEKEKAKLDKGKSKSAEKLLLIYKDVEQPYNVRLAALRSLEDSELPFVVESIKSSVANGDLFELDMINQSIVMLLKYNDSSATQSLIDCLKMTESKIMDVRENIVNTINTMGSEDEVLTLVELYEVSKINHQRMNELLALTLGTIGDDKVIPILMEIVTNKDLSINVRSQAIEVLAKKNSTDLVDYFVEILDDPSSNDELSRFTDMIFEDFEDPRMMMSLVESYQLGKSEYYRLLNSLISGMEYYQSPEISDALLDIAKNQENPHHIRIKAINALSEFSDESIVNEMLSMLQKPGNYKYYNEIIQLIEKTDSDIDVDENLRRAAFQAMQNHVGN
tara:strand:- start:5063 stop:6157 length:1095 start_codon:yes stop_codon:yes gene_type:complete